MDIFAHGFYNIALQKTIKKKENKKQILMAFFWGIMPDLFAFGPSFIFALFSGSLDHHKLVVGFDLANYIYNFTHSLTIFFLIFLAVYFLTKKWYLPILGWGLHILFDIFLHTPDFFPTPFLYPISSYVFPYGILWSTPIIWIGSWVVVLVWITFLFYKNKQ